MQPRPLMIDLAKQLHDDRLSTADHRRTVRAGRPSPLLRFRRLLAPAE